MVRKMINFANLDVSTVSNLIKQDVGVLTYKTDSDKSVVSALKRME